MILSTYMMSVSGSRGSFKESEVLRVASGNLLPCSKANVSLTEI